MSVSRSSGQKFEVVRSMVVCMVGGGAFITAIFVASLAGWIPIGEGPEQHGAMWLMGAFGTFSLVFGLAMGAWRITWDSTGLDLRIPQIVGIKRRRYMWSDLTRVTYKKHFWRVDCKDGDWFRVSIVNYNGGEALLREFARHGVQSDRGILETIELEKKQLGRR